MKKLWFAVGSVFGLTFLSIAMGSVPTKSRVTDDTLIYENLSEIRAARQGDLDFDGDIARLNSLEGRYREKLPARLSGPMTRISQQKYRHSGSQRPVRR